MLIQGLKFFAIIILTLAACLSLQAQLCKGSLGDPIVNITFGAGDNPGPQLTAAATGYQYIYTDCPNDGSYTVRNKSAACFGNSWHTLSSDHTGDANGYFMLINASLAPSAFYVDTVKDLCSNTTYEFAAWILNIMLPSACNGVGIQPNLTFTIEKKDGTILQTYNTNDIPAQTSPIWKQFGFFFSTPAGVSDIVLRIVNNAQGGCGNDLALDDITFKPCGPQITSSFLGNTNNTEHVCYGTAKTVTFTSSLPANFSTYALQWQSSPHNGIWTDIAGETSNILVQNFAANTPVGLYDFRVTAADPDNIAAVKCRVASTILFVQVAVVPVKSAGNNGPVCQNGILNLSAAGGTQYNWRGVNNFSATGSSVNINNVQLAAAGKYYVQVVDQYGCSFLDSTIAAINPSPVATTSFKEIAICTGKNVQLISSGGGTYSWLPVTGLSSAVIADPIAAPLIDTRYRVTITNQYACVDTASIAVSVNESPTANAGADRIIIAGTAIKLLATATGGSVTYLWTPSNYINDPAILQPTVHPPEDTRYTLTVTSANGCGEATAAANIIVFKAIYIPTAFTPNSDGVNDTWKIPALNAFPAFTLVVYNRLGQIVFENKNTNQAWDGTFKGEPAAAGSYVYIIDLKQAPGIIKGSVLIIR